MSSRWRKRRTMLVGGARRHGRLEGHKYYASSGIQDQLTRCVCIARSVWVKSYNVILGLTQLENYH